MSSSNNNNNNYDSIVFYLHAYLALRSQWPTNPEGKERARIVVIGLALLRAKQTILVNGPRERLKRRFLGSLVFNFLLALARRHDWTTAGVAIDTEEFTVPGGDDAEDPILQQVESLGFSELHRRAVEVLESWNHVSSEPKAREAVGGGNTAAVSSSGQSGGALDATPAPNEEGRRRHASGEPFIPPFKYCRACRRTQKRDLWELTCAPPGAEQACPECRKLKTKCTNRKVNLKFPLDPDRDTDNEREASEDIGQPTGSRSGSRQPSLAPPAIHLPGGPNNATTSRAPATLTVPQQATPRGRSRSPKPAKRTPPDSTSARVTRSRSRTPAPALPPPQSRNGETRSAPTPSHAVTGHQVGQVTDHSAVLKEQVERLDTLVTQHQSHIATLRSDTRGLIAGYKDARDDVGLLREMVKVHEASISRLEELRAKEVHQLQTELAEQRSEIVRLRGDLAAALTAAQLSHGTAADNQNLDVAPSRVPLETPTRSTTTPVSAPPPVSTRITTAESSTSPNSRVESGSAPSVQSIGGSRGDGTFSDKAYTLISTIPPVPEPTSSMKVPVAHGLVATSAFLGTTDASLKGVIPRHPPHAQDGGAASFDVGVPRSATPTDSTTSDLTDIEDADDSASASASNSGKNKRKAATNGLSTTAKKSKVATTTSLKPAAAARGKGRGRNPGVAPSRRSPRH
ncbi:hypothetical protein BKA70DRAFT_1236907 [Coprinopsis sp. MPI-PUGE-AT-0042]|nr:hypothetical protein BKA70DRAFT_1236907 [Coprinopsis sp. MPI-PUGE-AT-0042]